MQAKSSIGIEIPRLGSFPGSPRLLPPRPCKVLQKDPVGLKEEINDSGDTVLKQLQQLDKLVREASWRWARCLQHVFKLARLGCLLQWQLPDAVVARPLRAHERRVRHQRSGEWLILNKIDKKLVPECPNDWAPWFIVLHLDQCSVGRTVVHYSQYELKLLLEGLWDPYHMLWNSLKRGMTKAKGKYWRSMLLLQTRCNVSYGPWNHHEHKHTRRVAIERLIEGSTYMSAWFQDSLPKIAFDLGLTALPRKPEDQCSLYEQYVGKIKACLHMGPLTSCNRWFSIVKGIEFHDGEWTVERVSVQKYIEASLKRRLTEAETHLIWPTADPKKNAAAEVKQLRDQNENKDVPGLGGSVGRSVLGASKAMLLGSGVSKALPCRYQG